MLLKTKLDHTLSSIFGNCREKQTTTTKKKKEIQIQSVQTSASAKGEMGK